MHQPRPYGRFSREAELNDADAREVESLVRGLTNFKDVSSLDTLKRVRTLPSGRQAVAIDAGGTLRVIILEPYEAESYQFEGLAETNLPMLFSGVITKAIVKGGEQDPLGIDEYLGVPINPGELEGMESVKIKLTKQARKRLAGYEGKILSKKEVELHRFRIKYHQNFKYFEPKETGIYTFTQYAKQRPTWYSGTMAQVMQVVGGYGRQDFDRLPESDGGGIELERARMIVPERYMVKIRNELVNVRLPGYTGFPDEKGQFRCDYKFSKCHAVAFDAANKPWMLQVDSRGVYAMPLPLVPASTTEAFRRYVEDVGDEELELLLDRFGGLPTGESFPEDAGGFEAWRRAGVVIKVCDTDDFYDYQAYYAASGWSFNSKGTEGFNTCWTIDNRGLKQGLAYKMKIQLAAAPNHGLIPLEWEFKDEGEAREVDAYLASIYRKLTDNKSRELAIKYKIRRHTIPQIVDLMNQGGTDKVDYWDNLEMEPIAYHKGSVNRVSQGPIYWYLWMYPESQGRLKFPELSGKGCESFIMVSPDYRGPSVRCDTIVFGCYVDDSLQVIKYFTDDRKFKKKEKSTFVDHMIVGQWEKTVTTGISGLMGNFYTSSFDDRQEAPPVSTHTNIVGADLGYTTTRYKTPALIYRVGRVTRARHYSHLIKVENTEGFNLDCAVCVPAFNRDCILYPYKDGTKGRYKAEESILRRVSDPVFYDLWTHDSQTHWLGMTGNRNKGEPRPELGLPVYVDTMHFRPELDPTGFATSGDWLGLGGGTIDVSEIVGPYTSREVGNHYINGVIIGGKPPSFNPYSKYEKFDGESSGRVSISYTLAGSKKMHNRKPDQFYYDFSPKYAGGSPLFFYRDAVNITIGNAKYASCSEEDKHGARITWGHSELADDKSAHHFIGVINE